MVLGSLTCCQLPSVSISLPTPAKSFAKHGLDLSACCRLALSAPCHAELRSSLTWGSGQLWCRQPSDATQSLLCSKVAVRQPCMSACPHLRKWCWCSAGPTLMCGRSGWREEGALNQGHSEVVVDVWGLAILALSSPIPGEDCDWLTTEPQRGLSQEHHRILQCQNRPVQPPHLPEGAERT